MSSIDDRIVQMQFDNGQFEKGVSETNASLDELREHLQLDDGTAGLDNIQSTADGMNLSGISDAVEQISNAFSVLGVIGINVLSRLTQDALSMGQNLVASVVQPLIEGGKARAIALEQAQFQFRGLGLDIEATMTAAKAAVDGTAYGLQDAATAAAQFGASGITAGHGLESSLRAISGVAAQTGSDYGSIANIFEGIAGNTRVYTNDLNSLAVRGVNAAAVLAKSMGITEEKVRDMVTDGKISFQQFSDAMNAAFGENASKANDTYTGALANLKAAVTRIGADIFTPLDEAQRRVFVAGKPVIDNFKAAIQPLLGMFGELAATKATGIIGIIGKIDLTPLSANMPIIIMGLKNVQFFIEAIGRAIGGGFTEIFPPGTGPSLTTVAQAFERFTEALVPSVKTAENFKRVFAGFFAIIDIGIQIISGLFRAIFSLNKEAGDGASGILEFAAFIGDWLVKVDEAIKKGDIFGKIFGTIANGIQAAIAFIKVMVGLTGLFIESMLHINADGFKNIADKVKERLQPLFDIGGQIGSFFADMGKAISGFFSNLFKKADSDGARAAAAGENPVAKFFETIIEGIKKIKFSDITDAINTGLVAALGVSVVLFIAKARGVLGGITGAFQDVGKSLSGGFGIADGIKSVFGSVTSTFGEMQKKLRADILIKIAIAIAILTASVIALSFIDSARLAAAMGAITVMFANLAVIMKTLDTTLSSKNIGKISSVALVMIALSIAISILAGAVKKLADLDWNELSRGVLATVVLMGALVGAMKLLSKINVPEMIATAAGITIFAFAINLMAISVKKLAELSWEDLGKGIGAVLVIIAALIATTRLMSKDSIKMLVAAKALSTLALSMFLLAQAVKTMGTMDLDDVAKGVGAFALVITGLILAVRALGEGTKGTLFAVAALLALAASMFVIAQAVKTLGQMKPEDLVQGIIAFVAVIAGLILAVNAMQGSELGVASLIGAAIGLAIIGLALQGFAKLSWDDIGRVVVILAASLIILAGAMALMGIPLVLLGAVGLLAAAVALMAIAPALLLLGTMSWDAIGRGLTVLAAALVIMAVAGVLLIPAIPGLLGLGLAIALLGVGLLAAGIGIGLFAAGLAALAAGGQVAIQVFSDGIKAFIALLPQLGAGIGEAIVAMATVIGENAPQLLLAFVALLMTMLQAVDQIVPQLIIVATDIIVGLVNALVVLIPLLVDAGLKIIAGILKGVADNIEDIVTQGKNIIVNFIKGIGKALPDLLEAGAQLILDFINGLTKTIRNNTEKFNTAGTNLASAIIDGMTSGIRNGVGNVVRAITGVADGAIKAAKKALGIASPSKVFTALGEFTSEGFVNGIVNLTSKIARAASGMGDTAVDAVTNSISGISAAVNSNIDVQPTIRPVLDLSGVKKDANGLNTLFGDQTLSIDKVKTNADVAAKGYDQNQRVFTDADGQPSGERNVIYNQYNNSPKALSAVEIYRQTKNQLSVTKGELDKDD